MEPNILYGIATIIIAVVGSVQLVSHYAYKRGKEAGVSEGRSQVIIENLQRTDRELQAVREASNKIAA
jgi:hypothetical protein